MKLRTLTAIVALVGATALASQASAAGGNLLTNGNFETGDFTGWTVTDQAGGSGSWFVGGSGAPDVPPRVYRRPGRGTITESARPL